MCCRRSPCGTSSSASPDSTEKRRWGADGDHPPPTISRGRCSMRPDPREEDALNQLTELLDGIEERVESGHRIAVLDERNRITLLFGHAIFAILVAPGFAMITKTSMSSPSFVLVRNVPGAPYSFAVWIGLAGLGLAIATRSEERRVGKEGRSR